MDTIGKIAPQAIDMEEAVLGAIMIEKNAIDDVFPILKEKYLYKESHQHIFKAILKLHADSEPIDLLTVTESLRRADCLEEVGGPYYISQLTSKVASAANIEYHAQIILQKYLQRAFITYSTRIHQLSFDPNCDVDELMDHAGSELESIISEVFGNNSNQSYLPELLKQSLKEYDARTQLFKEGKVNGIPTPVNKLTHATNGWQNGDLIIVAGRPSMGKTAFVLACLNQAAKVNKKVAMFSLEMSGVRLTDRMLCGEADVMPERFRAGCLNSSELNDIEKAAGRLYNLGVYIDDNSGASMDYIKNRSRILHRKGECDLIIIDYLQLVETEKSKSKGREQEVAEMSRKAKLIAKELNVPVMLLAQLNRGLESRSDKRPMLSDLRESGSIEQDADVVILLYRAEYYGIISDDNGSTRGKGELNIAKQRNGRIGTIYFGYNESLTKIYDYMNPNDLSKDLLRDESEVPY